MTQDNNSQPPTNTTELIPADATDDIPQKTRKRKPKVSKIDLAIQMVVKDNPNLTPTEIANLVTGLGVSKHKQSVYNKLYAKDYKRASSSEIEAYHAELLNRQGFPLAYKRAVKALKDKDLEYKEIFPTIKLMFDKALGEKHIHTGAQQVNIGSVERIQVLINDTLNSVSSKDNI